MGDEIVIGGTATEKLPPRKLVPLQVGAAFLYIEAFSNEFQLGANEAIYPASMPSTREGFENAISAAIECVRTIGEKVLKLGNDLRPQELSVEFSLQLENTGKATIIPVLISGETKASAGFKVTAKWTRASTES
jgi:hypothetical protein